MHTDKNYMTARARINDSLAKRVIQSSALPYEERSSCSCGCSCGRGCGCGTSVPQEPRQNKSWGIQDYPLASMYAPLQEWRELYDEEAGFHRGTIFKELDLPFVCGERRGGNCRGK